MVGMAAAAAAAAAVREEAVSGVELVGEVC
jgi:hypothetical protein